MGDAVAPDGSPVDAYAALPAEPDLGVLRALLAGRHRILDLGCGTGRIADPLAQDGFDVVAVDESSEMLGRVRHAAVHRGSIQNLQLGRRFDAVLLLSHLINAANAAELLEVAARHLVAGGLLVAQRLEPGRSWQAGSGRVGPVNVDLIDVHVAGKRVVAATRYSLGERSWVQTWTLWERDDDDVRTLLLAADLRLISTDGVWITATR